MSEKRHRLMRKAARTVVANTMPHIGEGLAAGLTKRIVKRLKKARRA